MTAVVDIKNIMAAVGGEEALEVRLRRFEEDVRYLQSLKQELLRKYLNQWVAVYDKSIVAHGKTLAGVRKQLSAKGILPREAAIDFIAKERKAMLL
ncbi:MAG: hypothetical protein HY670_04355 [Chloroflexi bacterium]|nr:hypothetical protein [Chloroflexota bacterium]